SCDCRTMRLDAMRSSQSPRQAGSDRHLEPGSGRRRGLDLGRRQAVHLDKKPEPLASGRHLVLDLELRPQPTSPADSAHFRAAAALAGLVRRVLRLLHRPLVRQQPPVLALQLILALVLRPTLALAALGPRALREPLAPPVGLVQARVPLGRVHLGRPREPQVALGRRLGLAQSQRLAAAQVPLVQRRRHSPQLRQALDRRQPLDLAKARELGSDRALVPGSDRQRLREAGCLAQRPRLRRRLGYLALAQPALAVECLAQSQRHRLVAGYLARQLQALVRPVVGCLAHRLLTRALWVPAACLAQRQPTQLQPAVDCLVAQAEAVCLAQSQQRALAAGCLGLQAPELLQRPPARA
ncbi:hypothetical protein GGF47_005955, partial [Coemansia sp. RSA 2524]